VSCATPGSKHWRVDVLEAERLEELAAAPRRTVLPGDRRHAVKDPVIALVDGEWHLWASLHPLDLAQQEDRMTAEHYTSLNGIRWKHQCSALRPRSGHWDARGVRLSAGSVIKVWVEHLSRRVPTRRSVVAMARGARTGLGMMRMAALICWTFR
jgi:hypothetical protein